MFIWVIYYVVLIELLKNMWSKEQNSRTSNYVDIMGMFINSGLAGNVYSSGIFVTFFFSHNKVLFPDNGQSYYFSCQLQ